MRILIKDRIRNEKANKKQKEGERNSQKQREMEQTQGRGAGPHTAKRDRTAQILPQEQEVQQESRARQGEATVSQ